MFRAPACYDSYNGLWRSTLSFLDGMYVAKGLKRTSIIFLDDKRIPLLREFCSANGICFELSDHKLLLPSDTSKGSFSNSAGPKIPATDSRGHFAVFLSLAPLEAKLAKFYYGRGDHVKMGALLGYPSCCSEFFSGCMGNGSGRTRDFIPHAVRDTRQYDFFNNRALRYFDMSLISHFPCSLACSASRALAKERLAFLRDQYPKIAEVFEKYLKSMVIYTDANGVFFSNNYSLDRNLVGYRELHGTVENELSCRLKEAGEVTIDSHNRLRIGKELLKGDICILLFK
jgi:hypothetical protein